VALLLRSAEIQPLFVRFVINSIIDVEYYLLFIDTPIQFLSGFQI